MSSLKKVILFGFLAWLVPFAAGFVLFPIHESNRALFESVMPVVVVGTVVLLGYKYLKKAKNPKNEAWKLGIVWLLMNIVIDLALFLPPSPMHMGIVEYMQDIGLTYFVIPLITIALGHSMGGPKENH
ncbi:MAG TPA: hypothetical protein DDW36_00510 [Candidatus Magasanikbacteria bacterium]|nr:hypothetical protein [Candidatus Magasanikbacteria bacterium]